MINIPLNHKTIFLFDNANFFASNCGQTFDFDVASTKAAKSNPNQSQSSLKLNPLNKSLWTCNVESALEYSRIVFDLFPENKLIAFVVTNYNFILNSWNESEQSLDHVT